MPDNNRKSFIVFCDRMNEIAMLNTEQIGRLFIALMNYASSGNIIQEDEDVEVKILFSVMKCAIDENGEKYERRCERNRQIAQEREEKRKHERERTYTNVHERARTFTKSTDTDTDTDTDNESPTETKKSGNHAHDQKRVSEIISM